MFPVTSTSSNDVAFVFNGRPRVSSNDHWDSVSVIVELQDYFDKMYSALPLEVYEQETTQTKPTAQHRSKGKRKSK
jgi:hypothetical protein